MSFAATSVTKWYRAPNINSGFLRGQPGMRKRRFPPHLYFVPIDAPCTCVAAPPSALATPLAARMKNEYLEGIR